MSETPPPRSWARRHGWVIAATLACLALAIDAGYQVYAARIQHRNAAAVATTKKNAAKLTRLTKVQCANTQLIYDFFNALALDSSPHFGSPPGRIVPGARQHLIEKLYDNERVAVAPLRKQGCVVTVPASG